MSQLLFTLKYRDLNKISLGIRSKIYSKFTPSSHHRWNKHLKKTSDCALNTVISRSQYWYHAAFIPRPSVHSSHFSWKSVAKKQPEHQKESSQSSGVCVRYHWSSLLSPLEWWCAQLFKSRLKCSPRKWGELRKQASPFPDQVCHVVTHVLTLPSPIPTADITNFKSFFPPEPRQKFRILPNKAHQENVAGRLEFSWKVKSNSNPTL